MKDYTKNPKNTQNSVDFAGAQTTGALRSNAYLTKTNICTTTPVDFDEFLHQIDLTIKLFSRYIFRTREWLELSKADYE